MKFIRSESCDYFRERNPFYSSSMKSVKFKDINRLSPISRSNNENLTKEINELKSKINDIRESNSNIIITKNQLQNQIDNLQHNISKSLKVIKSFNKKIQIFLIINLLTNLRSLELSPVRSRELTVNFSKLTRF